MRIDWARWMWRAVALIGLWLMIANVPNANAKLFFGALLFLVAQHKLQTAGSRTL